MKDKVDMTPAVNEVIDTGIKNGVVNSKQVRIKYHTTGELYTRCRILFILVAAGFPELTFISYRHYDEKNDPIGNFNDDFIVGAYTPLGPVTFHFKNEFLDEFKGLNYIENAPLYDGYSEEEAMHRLYVLAMMKFSGKTVDEIAAIINNNPFFHESWKPKQLKK